MRVSLPGKGKYSASLTRLPLAFDFARDAAWFEPAMELARRVAESLPVRGNQVHLPAHQFTPIHVSHGRPGHLYDLPRVFMRRDARCGIVPSLVLAAPGPAQPAQTRTKPIADANVDQTKLATAAQPVDPGIGRDRARLGSIELVPTRPDKPLPARTVQVLLLRDASQRRSCPARAVPYSWSPRRSQALTVPGRSAAKDC